MSLPWHLWRNREFGLSVWSNAFSTSGTSWSVSATIPPLYSSGGRKDTIKNKRDLVSMTSFHQKITQHFSLQLSDAEHLLAFTANCQDRNVYLLCMCMCESEHQFYAWGTRKRPGSEEERKVITHTTPHFSEELYTHRSHSARKKERQKERKKEGIPLTGCAALAICWI